MSEESRIESSFGPIKLVNDHYTKGNELALTYSHHIPITVVKALVVPMHVARGAEMCRP